MNTWTLHLLSRAGAPISGTGAALDLAALAQLSMATWLVAIWLVVATSASSPVCEDLKTRTDLDVQTTNEWCGSKSVGECNLYYFSWYTEPGNVSFCEVGPNSKGGACAGLDPRTSGW